jgi:pilus assembly protein CpaE
MKSLRVAVLASDIDQQGIEAQLEATGLTRTVHVSNALPRTQDDPTFEDLRQSKPDVVLIDIPAQAQPALECIEFLHFNLPDCLLVPVGNTTPQLIVSAMRAGAGEYLERPLRPESLREAISRAITALDKRSMDNRARLYCFINAKGGSGATTAAVNTAVALAAKDGPVLLIDLSNPGATSLQLNVRPRFTLADAFANFQRLDWSLLESLMTDCSGGLMLLAGADEPLPPCTSDTLARIMDALTPRFRHIVIDASSRFDELSRACCEFSDQVLLVAQPEVGALWSAAKVRKYLASSCHDHRIGLLLNRYRKMSGLDDEQIESAVGCKILWTIQNQYISVARSIENGIPVARDRRSELSKAFAGLAALLLGEKPEELPAQEKRNHSSVFEKLAAARSFSFSSTPG